MDGSEWTTDEARVSEYLARADEFPHRLEGEGVLLEDVDCYWKWLEMALLIGVRPA